MSESIQTERIIPLKDKKNKENKPTHARATSMQNEFGKESCGLYLK